VATVAWISLAFLLVAVVGSSAYLVLRGLRAWRMLRSFSRTAAQALDRVTGNAAAAEQHALSLTSGMERLTVATEHLQGSLAELAVLRAAADEARAAGASLRGAVPRK
jgi:hypothetical protein